MNPDGISFFGAVGAERDLRAIGRQNRRTGKIAIKIKNRVGRPFASHQQFEQYRSGNDAAFAAIAADLKKKAKASK